MSMQIQDDDRRPLLTPNISDAPAAIILGSADATEPWYTPRGAWQLLTSNYMLVFWFFVATIGGVGQAVTLVQAGQDMSQFAFFIFWFTALWFAVLFYLAWLAVDLFYPQSITPAMRRFPQWKLAVIGVLSTLNGILVLFPNHMVPGAMQALLGPTISVIPISMVFSFFLLRRRYSLYQVGAVAIIVAGCVVAIWPALMGAKGVGPPLQDFFFLCSGIPLAFSNVYEEVFFEHEEVHLAHILAYSSIYQTLSIFLVFPLMFIPGLHWQPAGVHSLADLWHQQVWAFRCLVGRDVPLDVCADCNCGSAFKHLAMFVVFYVLTNAGQLGIIQHGNAVFTSVVSTLGVPLSEFAFAMPWIMGSQVEKLTVYNYAALGVLLLGTVVYRFVDVKKHKENVYESQRKASANEVVETTVVVMPAYNTMAPTTIVSVVDRATHDRHTQAASFFYKTI